VSGYLDTIIVSMTISSYILS